MQRGTEATTVVLAIVSTIEATLKYQLIITMMTEVIPATNTDGIAAISTWLTLHFRLQSHIYCRPICRSTGEINEKYPCTSSCVDFGPKTRLNWNGFLVWGGRISVSDGN